jgi:hypothetical protein
MRYIKDNWPDLLFTLVASACSATFALGFAWAMLGGRVASAERRLDGIDSAHVDQTHWQVEQNSASISSSDQLARQMQSQLAQISVRLGVIDAKLDALRESVKPHE